MHPQCQSADPHASVSSAACKAWPYACSTNSVLLLQAEGGQSGGPHKGAGLMSHVYTRKLEQAQQVRTQRINLVCASLSAITDCLRASCLHCLCTRCLSNLHASGCCHASLFATSGRSKNVCCVCAESCHFSETKECKCLLQLCKLVAVSASPGAASMLPSMAMCQSYH